MKRLGMGIALAATLVAGLLGPVQASASPAYLKPGYFMTGGQSISTGQFRLIMQYDGNLVLYNQAGRPLWASRTNSCRCYAIMQNDGNLVVYRDTMFGDTAVWSSRTYGRPGAYLVLQDDGNLVLKQGSTPVWATGTVYSKLYPPDYLRRGQSLFSPNGRYRLVVQHDGNVVLYNQQTRRALWATGTTRGAGFNFAMGRDGNLVVYSLLGKVAWASGTVGNPGAYLNLQSDGNLVLYRGSRAIWATNTQNR